MTAAVYIAEKMAFVHIFHCQNHIFRTAGQRIRRFITYHAADFKIRVDCVSDFHGFRAGDKFIMRRLKQRLPRVRFILKDNARIYKTHKRTVYTCLIVDFIECHPVFYFIFIPLEADFRISYEKVYQLAVTPCAVFRNEIVRHFKMRQCNDGLDIVL